MSQSEKKNCYDLESDGCLAAYKNNKKDYSVYEVAINKKVAVGLGLNKIDGILKNINGGYLCIENEKEGENYIISIEKIDIFVYFN